MILKSSKIYHLFLALAILNSFPLFFSNSTLAIHKVDKSFWTDYFFNFSISISLLLFLIWLSYWAFRNKLHSGKMIWLHLFITFITVFILPPIITNHFNPMPRRYLDYNHGFKLSDFYGGMAFTFLVVVLVLLISESLLIANIRQQPEKITLFEGELLNE